MNINNAKVKNILHKVKKLKVKTFFESLLVLGFLFFLFLIVFAYIYPQSGSSFSGKILSKISYPIVIVGDRDFILSSELGENLFILKKYYESEDVSREGKRVDFSTEEGLKRLKVKEREILNKKIENKAMMILAKKRGISVSDKYIRNYFNYKISIDNFLGQSLESFNEKYGWGEEEIKNEIIIPIIYTEELSKIFSTEVNSNEQASKIIEEVKKELENGGDFEQLAKKYSQGQSANNGGSLGWIARDQIVPEVSEYIFSNSTKKQDNFEIVESELGFHIIKIEEIKKEDGVDLVRMSHIFTRKISFANWLKDEMKDMRIKILAKDYIWDKDKSEAIFTDDSMQEFENKIKSESSGDASISNEYRL